MLEILNTKLTTEISAYTGSYSATLTITIYYYSAPKLMLILPSHIGQKINY